MATSFGCAITVASPSVWSSLMNAVMSCFGSWKTYCGAVLLRLSGRSGTVGKVPIGMVPPPRKKAVTNSVPIRRKSMPCSSIAVRLSSATVTSSITCRGKKSATKRLCTSGLWAPSSHTVSVVSLKFGWGVKVVLETVARRSCWTVGPTFAPSGFGSCLPLIRIVRGLRTTTPAISGLPTETRRTGRRNWTTRLLPDRSQHRLRGGPRRGLGLGGDGLCFRTRTHGMAGRPLDELLLEPRVRLGRWRRDGAGPEQRYPEESSRAGDVPTEHNHPIPLPPSVPTVITCSEKILARHMVAEQHLHRVPGTPWWPRAGDRRPGRRRCRGRRRGDGPLRRGPEQGGRRESGGADHLVVAVVAQREPHRLVLRGEREPLGVLRGDQQRDRGHLDRLVLLLRDALPDGKDADALEDQLAPLPFVALPSGRSSDEHVHPAVRRDEPAHAGDVIDAHRHRSHPVRDHGRQDLRALSQQLGLAEWLVLLDGHARDRVDDGLGILDRPVRHERLGPPDDLHLLLSDMAPDGDRVAGHDDVDGAGRGLARRLDFAAQGAQVAVDQGGGQGADDDRQEKQVPGSSHHVLPFVSPTGTVGASLGGGVRPAVWSRPSAIQRSPTSGRRSRRKLARRVAQCRVGRNQYPLRAGAAWSRSLRSQR